MPEKSKLIWISAIIVIVLLILLFCLFHDSNEPVQETVNPTAPPTPVSTVAPSPVPATPEPTESPAPETPVITPPAVFSVDAASASDILIQIIPPSSDSDISLSEKTE